MTTPPEEPDLTAFGTDDVHSYIHGTMRTVQALSYVLVLGLGIGIGIAIASLDH